MVFTQIAGVIEMKKDKTLAEMLKETENPKGFFTQIEEEPVPFCHGELMQPCYRYKNINNGKIYRIFECHFLKCSRKVKVEVKE